MTNAFDSVGGLRLLKIGIQIGSKSYEFEDLDIRVQGQKYAGPTFGSCVIKISNLNRDLRNDILTRATPLIPDRIPAAVYVDVGRESYGYFRLFQGQVVVSTVLPPPDIGIILRSLIQTPLTALMYALPQNSLVPLKTILQNIASKNGWKLDITKLTVNPQIANFSPTTSGQKMVNQIQAIGGVRAYIDNDTLIVTDPDAARGNTVFHLSQETGMVGVPQATESGCIVQCLVNPGINIGQGISIDSKINPAVNRRDYYVAKMTYDIANRDNPFYYTLTCTDRRFPNGTTL